MCGICGRLQFARDAVERSLIARMCDTLVHRGPDGEGIYTAPHIGLGQRRLAIIDLRPEATGPLANEDGTVWVTFNGEIYNFRELRTALLERGHVFRTSTDTEVIVHLYEDRGVDCLAELRGMFAFALWDAKRRRLFAARDRLGEKPLFYSSTGDGLVFGSEIKAITADPSVPVDPNYRAIDEYLTYQYVPSPLTAFERIQKLPPAHFLTCDVHGTLEVRRYWSPPLAPKSTAEPREITYQVLSRLREAVRMRLVADVPVGAFLSGGVDSATVVAIMAEQSDRPVRTFSIGFEDASHDELPFARRVAERYGTEHHEFIVAPRACDVLPLLVHHYNEPFADSSAVAVYHVSRLSREHVTVALSGDGGDENFAGYANYWTVARWARADGVPLSARRAMGWGLGTILDRLPHYTTVARASRGLYMFGARLPERWRLHSMILKPQEKESAYTHHFRELLAASPAALDGPAHLPWNETMDDLDWMMRHDQHFYLPDCMMVKTDTASMANSLEVRCPFLDHPFVEFTATIPSVLKREGSNGKLIFKQAVRELLPPEILARRKSGFSLPLARWFRGELLDLLRGTLLGERALRRNLFEAAFMRSLVEEHAAGRRDWSSRLWALLFLELWFQRFFD